MELIDYPEAIAEQARKSLKVSQQVQQRQAIINSLVNAVSHQVAFDPTLKNQNQRDVRKTELLNADKQYTEKLAELQALRNELNLLRIDLEYLRNKFAAVRLAVAVKLDVSAKLGDTASAETVRAHLAGMALQSVFSSVYFSLEPTLPLEVAERAVTFADALVARLDAEGTPDGNFWSQKVYSEENFGVEDPEDSQLEEIEFQE